MHVIIVIKAIRYSRIFTCHR